VCVIVVQPYCNPDNHNPTQVRLVYRCLARRDRCTCHRCSETDRSGAQVRCDVVPIPVRSGTGAPSWAPAATLVDTALIHKHSPLKLPCTPFAPSGLRYQPPDGSQLRQRTDRTSTVNAQLSTATVGCRHRTIATSPLIQQSAHRQKHSHLTLRRRLHYHHSLSPTLSPSRSTTPSSPA
jgi:hypothetical protein